VKIVVSENIIHSVNQKAKNQRLLMKRLTFISCMMVVFLWGAVCAYAAPRLTVPESVFNFGYVPQNSTVSHVFWLYSTGDDTLKIINVAPG